MWTRGKNLGETEGRPPNIILILPDQQRFDSLGCYGNRNAISPHIDRLASEGACFESAFVTQPLCSAARSSILTGLFPHKTEVWDNDVTLTDHTTSFPRLLHDIGYTTGYVGKWHLGPKPEPFDRPISGRPIQPPPDYFDVWQGHDGGASQWVGEPMEKWTVPDNHESAIPDFGREEPGEYRVDFEFDHGIQFIREHHQNPFCLIVSFRPPHTPWTAPRENCERFQGKVQYPTYYAMVNRIDENVGRMVDVLNALGLEQNTLIVYTSDHGHDFVYRWNPQPKRNCYDTASRIPLIFHWIGKIKPGVRSELVSHADLVPTILDLCGLDIPAGLHGHSARELLLSGKGPWRDSVYIQNHPYRQDGRYCPPESDPTMFERCIVTNEWKLIVNSERPPELYHRPSDPDEINNRFRGPGLEEVLRTLFRKLEDWAWQIGDGQALSKWLLYKWYNGEMVIGQSNPAE